MTYKRGAFLVTLDLAEKLFSLPVSEREAYLVKMAQEKQATFLGVTDKTPPELATEFIKKGIKAQSFITGADKKKDLTITKRADRLLEEKEAPDVIMARRRRKKQKP